MFIRGLFEEVRRVLRVQPDSLLAQNTLRELNLEKTRDWKLYKVQDHLEMNRYFFYGAEVSLAKHHLQQPMLQQVTSYHAEDESSVEVLCADYLCTLCRTNEAKLNK